MNRLFFILLSAFSAVSNAQNVNIQLRVNELHHGYDCGNDGVLGDQPDPRWKLWGGHSGGNYTLYTGAVANCDGDVVERSGVACGAITDFTPFLICNYTNVAYTQVNAQMECWEEDGCGGNCTYNTCFLNDDDNYSGPGTIASIDFRTFAPCAWNDRGVFYRDATDQYGARLEVYWEYVSLNAGSIAGAQTICSGGDPSPITSTNNGSDWMSYQWQYSDGGCSGPWTDIPGANSASYDPPVLTNTRCYRRVGSSCNAPDVISNTVTITVEQPSSITAVSASPTSLCGGGSADLTVTGTLGTGAQWEVYSGSCGGTLEATSSSSPISVTPSATTNYFVLGTATSQCPATACFPVTVTVNAASTGPASINASATSICSGTAVTLDQVGGVLGTGATFEWYSASCGGTSVGTGSSISVSPTTTTTYFVRAESAGCGNTTCAQITINVEQPSSITSASASPASLCGTGSTNITISGSLGTGAQWEIYTGSCVGALEASSGTSPITIPSVSSSTTYYVLGSSSTGGVCPATSCEIVNVTVNTPSTDPTGATATSTTICNGSSTQLSVQGGALGTGAAWEWYSGSCGGTPVGTGASINVSPTVTTDYFVRAEGACGNTLCANVTITVETPSTDPVSAAAATPTFCLGGNTNLTVAGGTIGTGADYVWYTGGCGSGAPIGAGTTINVSPTVTTTYFVRLEGNCNNTNCQTVTVTVEQPSTDPATALASQAFICPGQSTVLTVSGGSLGTGATWEWFESSCGGVPAGSGSSISVIPTATTTYFVQAVGTCNSTNCANVTITIGTGSTPPTSADLTIDNICPGDTTEIFQVGGVIGGSDKWVWYTGACGAVTVGVGDTLAVAPTTTTTYYVRAVGNCGVTTCQPVTVNVLPGSITPTGITASDNNFCEGTSVTLDVVGGSLVTGANWTWYANSCGGTAIGTGISITLTPSTTSTYYVRGEGGSCGNTECAGIFINVLETEAYFVFVDTICGLGAPFNLTGGLPVGGTYSGPGVAANAFNPSAAGVGTHTLTYTYTNANGCSASASTDVTVGTASLVAEATVTPAECADGGVKIIVTASGGDGNYSYTWSDGSTGNPLNYAQTGTYTVSVTDGSGCGTFVDSIDVSSDVNCVELPNTFTPNEDGVNDTWNVDFSLYGGAKSVQVFSKWGQLVYEISNVNNISWNGEWNGKDLPAGTYYYIIELNDAAYGQQNGPLTIVR